MQRTWKPGACQEDWISWQTSCRGKGQSFKQSGLSIRDGLSDISYLGQATHRPVRFTSELETSAVCISCSGTRGMCKRYTESFGWECRHYYAFPIFPLILTCLKKIQEEECLVCQWLPIFGYRRTSMVSSTFDAFGNSCNLSPMEEGSIVSTNVQKVASHSSVLWLLCNKVYKCHAILSLLPDESIQQNTFHLQSVLTIFAISQLTYLITWRHDWEWNNTME